MNDIFVVIPSYEPDVSLCNTIRELHGAGISNIIVINDGSDDEFEVFFNDVRSMGCMVLSHVSNRGKGAALKTAFGYIIEHYPNAIGCVTADSDGQHSTEDIKRIAGALKDNPRSLILGCRNFDGDCIPFKSRFGNRITKSVFRILCRMDISDTQTGLRGLDREFMKRCLDLPGNRFEYETQMLLLARDTKTNIIQVPINTIYDSADNHFTHFNPLKDSFKIYWVIIGRGMRYTLSSILSAALDLVLFALFSMNISSAGEAFLCTVLARICSSCFNYSLNRNWVFKKSSTHSACRYFVLMLLNLVMSGVIVSYTLGLIGFGPVRILVKACVDCIIFFLNYVIQKKLVFSDIKADPRP